MRNEYLMSVTNTVSERPAFWPPIVRIFRSWVLTLDTRYACVSKSITPARYSSHNRNPATQKNEKKTHKAKEEKQKTREKKNERRNEKK